MSKTFQFSTDIAEPNDDIELEYEIDPNVLNQKYTGFKKQYEEEELEEEEEGVDDDESEDDEDYIEDQKVNEELYDDEEEYEIDDEEEEVDLRDEEDDYATIALKFVLRIAYKVKKNWIKVALYSLLFIVNLLIISYFTQSGSSSDEIITNIKSFGDISKSIQGLQWQINDLNSKNKNKFHEFRHYLDSKIDEFNNKFVQLDSDLKNVQKSNDEIIVRLDSINFENLGQGSIEDSKLPIILDQHNNIKILPEFADFLEKKISNIISNHESQIDIKFKLNYENFIEEHLQDLLNNKIGFMNKDEVLSIISLQFQENKKKLISEIKKLNTKAEIPKNLVNNEVNKPSSNQIGKVNYGQAISGARIINYLTSPTFKPKTKGGSFLSKLFGSSNNQQDIEDETTQQLLQSSSSTSPFIVLTGNQGYWRSSQVKNTRLAIKFLEPIYLSELAYIHERVINGAILTSAPKKIELYVQVENNQALIEEIGNAPMQDGHVKISELNYSLNESEEQYFKIPSLIKPYLIKSIILQVPENYGNEFFTSIYKLKIHGLTRFDLYSIKKIMNDQDIDDVIKNKLQFKSHDGQDRQVDKQDDKQDKHVPKFGSDPVVS